MQPIIADRDIRRVLLAVLTPIADGTQKHLYTGLCSAASTALDEQFNYLIFIPVAYSPYESDRITIVKLIGELAASWDEYTGDYKFPVPGGQAAYGRFNTRNHNFITNRSEYGKARRRLAQHLVTQIQNM